MLETPAAFSPVIVRFVVGSTVATVDPLEPKLYVMVPADAFTAAESRSGKVMLYDQLFVPVFVYFTVA